MLILWAILFFALAVILGMFAVGGIAVAISFFTKILFFLSLICFIVAFILVIIEKILLKEKQMNKSS